MDEDNTGKWTNVGNAVTNVHHYSKPEIEQMVVNPERDENREESSNENEKDVAERTSIAKLIQLTDSEQDF
ncbi:Hypothetical predicted protein [Octopus vulgaris]|uniref:Uncharacterized protein n=1 Tax=Octopus vulgaris TaxID=6645 RepID=A0AA36B8E0_OCTVU|nr:Hypothetical predicted protein [Octopus vulgaris]